MSSFGVESYTKKRKKTNNGSKIYVFILLFLIVILGNYFFKQYNSYKEEKNISEQVVKVNPRPIVVPDNILYNLIEYEVQSGDTAAQIFKEHGMDPTDVYEIIETSKNVYDLSLIKQGDILEIGLSKKDETFQKLKYEISNEEIFVIKKNKEGKYESYLEEIKYNTLLKESKGIIKESLYKSAVMEQGLSPKLIVDLADVFAWDVDFTTNIREDDSFSVYYEEKHRKGNSEKVITGKILAAKFVNQDEPYYAFGYLDNEEKFSFYDEKGNSLEKQFLRSPVQFKYISSGYTNSRFHPILKKYLPHKSIDYVAPYGTPVVSIGDGTVTYVGLNNGWGKTVNIRYGAYSTRYGHLSKYGKGIVKGAKVKQGDIIGYIGMTGYTTGPHLDFTFYKNGDAVNFLTIKFPSISPVAEEEMEKYLKLKDELMLKL